MDKIKIIDLEIFANHGVYPEENALGQKFLVSAILFLDTRDAGQTDDLNLSVNYGTISHLINESMKKNQFLLIEKVAEHLAKTILLFDPRILEITIEVKKPWAPIGLPLKTVSVEIHRKWHEVYLSIGSNMGDREQFIEQAISSLAQLPDCHIKKVSEILETEPYGGVAQDAFLNGAIHMTTLLSPKELLDALHKIEQDAGRERLIHWGPRTLDLDILFYDHEVVEDVNLCIPHVDLQNRWFVLKPLSEIAPYLRHPVYGKTVTELLSDLLQKGKDK